VAAPPLCIPFMYTQNIAYVACAVSCICHRFCAAYVQLKYAHMWPRYEAKYINLVARIVNPPFTPTPPHIVVFKNITKDRSIISILCSSSAESCLYSSFRV
jgi:hypothetical protein